jgi:hypothetical protein
LHLRRLSAHLQTHYLPSFFHQHNLQTFTMPPKTAAAKKSGHASYQVSPFAF